MSELAATIQAHTAKMEEHLIARGDHLPSLDVNGLDPRALPQHLKVSRQMILDSISELQTLALGPVDYLMEVSVPKVYKAYSSARLLC